MSPPIKSIIHSPTMNHNEERQHMDTVFYNTGHLNPSIVFPVETGTQESSREESITQESCSRKTSLQHQDGLDNYT